MFCLRCIGGYLRYTVNKNHPRRSFYYKSSVSYAFRNTRAWLLVWLYFFFVQSLSWVAVAKMFLTYISLPTCRKFYAACMGRLALSEAVRMSTNQLGPFVEIDETWFATGTKYNRGRYVPKTHTMVPTFQVSHHCVQFEVFGCWCRAQRLLYMWPVPDRKMTTLMPLITGHIQPRSRINSDGYSGYQCLNHHGYRHAYCIHGK